MEHILKITESSNEKKRKKWNCYIHSDVWAKPKRHKRRFFDTISSKFNAESNALIRLA